jgi:hypothetical protein
MLVLKNKKVISKIRFYFKSIKNRVDMTLGLHKIMIVLKEKKDHWKFVERYNREEPMIYEFNQENFEQLMTDFIEDI